MTKLKLKVFSGSDCREYTTKKGNTYDFHKGHAKEVKDPEDALEFLQCSNGTAFETEGPIKTAIAALKKLIPKKKVDEEKPPEETGNLEPTDEDKKDVKDMSNIEEKVEPTEETGNLEPTDEDKKEVGEMSNIEEKVNPTDKKEKCEKCGGTNVHYKDGCLDCGYKENAFEGMTKDGLKALNAKQQTFMIKKVQGEDAKIPRVESGKIELLLKLQKDGANLLDILKGYVA